MYLIKLILQTFWCIYCVLASTLDAVEYVTFSLHTLNDMRGRSKVLWAREESVGERTGVEGREVEENQKRFHKTIPIGAWLEGPLMFRPLGVWEPTFPKENKGKNQKTAKQVLQHSWAWREIVRNKVQSIICSQIFSESLSITTRYLK